MTLKRKPNQIFRNFPILLCSGQPYRKFKSSSDPHNPQKEFKDIPVKCVGQVRVLRTNVVVQKEKTFQKLCFIEMKRTNVAY